MSIALTTSVRLRGSWLRRTIVWILPVWLPLIVEGLLSPLSASMLSGCLLRSCHLDFRHQGSLSVAAVVHAEEEARGFVLVLILHLMGKRTFWQVIDLSPNLWSVEGKFAVTVVALRLWLD